MLRVILWQRSLQELEEVGVPPSGELSLGLDSAFVGALALGQIHRQLAEQSEGFAAPMVLSLSTMTVTMLSRIFHLGR